MVKERYCKCGHNRKDHKQSKKFYGPRECSKCRCNLYLNRKGQLELKIYLFFGVFCSVMFLIIPFQIMVLEHDAFEKIKNKQAAITIGDLMIIVTGTFLIIILVVLIPYFIYPYFDHKYRKEYPIEGDETK